MGSESSTSGRRGDRDTCEVRDWVVFYPGYHKGELYGEEQAGRMADNFARLRSHLTPVVKIGHDSDQLLAERLKRSLGFLNVGRVTGVKRLPGGRTAITITGIPVEVGEQINAGTLNSGSVEIIPWHPDPSDPAKRIEGPVLTAISLLGEEQPALKGLPPPRAVFADGTPVPPAKSVAKWLTAMAEVTKEFALASRGRSLLPRRYAFADCSVPVATICFSEMGMNPDAMKQQLMSDYGLPDDAIPSDPSQLAKLHGAMTGSKFSSHMKKKFAGDLPDMGGAAPPAPPAPPAASPPPGPPLPDQNAAFADEEFDLGDDDGDEAPPYAKKMMSAMKKFAAHCTKRMGALEAAQTGMQKADEEAKTAAFAERVDAVLAAATGKIPPVLRASFRQAGLNALKTRQFGDRTHANGEAAFQAWKAEIDRLPVTRLFSDQVVDQPNRGEHPLTANGMAVLNALATSSPRVHQRLTQPKQ